MQAIKRLKHFWIMLYATLTTIFMIEFGNFPLIAAAIFGALNGFGLLVAIKYTSHCSYE